METFSALLALFVGNSPVTGEFRSQRPVMRSFHVFFDLHLNKQLSKQQRRRWFQTPSRSLWRHCNVGRIGDTITSLLHHNISPGHSELINCDRVTPYNDIGLGEHCLGRHQVISWTNGGFSVVRFCEIRLREISQRRPKLIFCVRSLKMIV